MKLTKKRIAELESQRMPPAEREIMLKLFHDMLDPKHPLTQLLLAFNGQHGTSQRRE